MKNYLKTEDETIIKTTIISRIKNYIVNNLKGKIKYIYYGQFNNIKDV